jgi:hypothetical protein
MSDVLLIAGSAPDDELVELAVHHHASRVTVLVPGEKPDWAFEDSAEARATRDRIAHLLTAVEERTGARVVGLAGTRAQLQGWRFDHEVGAGKLAAA